MQEQYTSPELNAIFNTLSVILDIQKQGYRESPAGKDNLQRQLIRTTLIDQLKILNPSDQEVEAYYQLALATRENCSFGSTMLFLWLQKHYPQVKPRLIYSEGRSSHFPSFHMALAFEITDGTWVIASPGNAFNPDFTLPIRPNGEVFWRHKDLIINTSYEGAYSEFIKIEGEFFKWKTRPVTPRDIELLEIEAQKLGWDLSKLN